MKWVKPFVRSWKISNFPEFRSNYESIHSPAFFLRFTWVSVEL